MVRRLDPFLSLDLDLRIVRLRGLTPPPKIRKRDMVRPFQRPKELHYPRKTSSKSAFKSGI